MNKKIHWSSQIYVLSKVKILINIFTLLLFIPIAIFLFNRSSEFIFYAVLTTIIMILWPTVLRKISDEEYSVLQIFIYKKVEAIYTLENNHMAIEYLGRKRKIDYNQIISFSLTSPFNFGKNGELPYSISLKYNTIYLAIKYKFYTEILPVFISADKEDDILKFLSLKVENSKYLKTESNFLMVFGYILIIVILFGTILLSVYTYM